MKVTRSKVGVTISLTTDEAGILQNMLWAYATWLPYHRQTSEGLNMAVRLELALAEPEVLAPPGPAPK